MDGRDRWLFITIIDQRNGQSTSLAIKISDELLMEIEKSPGAKSNVFDRRNYYDISLNYNITVNADGTVNSTLSESRGDFRTSVSRGLSIGDDERAARRNIWWSDLFTVNSHKDDDIGEGYLLTGEDGGPGDPFGPGAKKVDVIDNADALLSMLGNWREFGAKIEPAELIKELGGWQKIKKILESADNASDALSSIDDACNGCMQIIQKPEIKPAPVERTDTIDAEWMYYKRDKNGKFITSGSIGAQKARETIPGSNGAPDTNVKRVLRQPPVPKKDIPRNP